MKPVSPAPDCMDEAARLLPWLVNGTLPPAERQLVEAHLETCPTCRGDAAALTQVRTLVRSASQVEHAPHGGLSKLMQRVDGTEAAPMFTAPGRLRAGGMLRWLTTAVVLQSVALAVVGVVALRGQETEDAVYRTHTAAPAAVPAAALRVVFAPTLTLAELQALLQANGLVVLSGPSEAGLFSLALRQVREPAAERAAAVARLRADPRVRFAEPLGPEAPAP